MVCKINVVILGLAFILSSCTSASDHARNVNQETQGLTVGTVQKEIKIGMSGADVAAALGSPNIVSTDSNRNEVWIYDKVSTTHVRSSSNSWFFGVIAGGKSNSGASSSSQKTLTIIIKFNDKKLVRDFAYHTSKF